MNILHFSRTVSKLHCINISKILEVNNNEISQTFSTGLMEFYLWGGIITKELFRPVVKLPNTKDLLISQRVNVVKTTNHFFFDSQ